MLFLWYQYHRIATAKNSTRQRSLAAGAAGAAGGAGAAAAAAAAATLPTTRPTLADTMIAMSNMCARKLCAK